MKTFSFSFFSIFLIISCQMEFDDTSNKLDYFFDPQKTDIILSFSIDDSVSVSMSLWQFLEDSNQFETTITSTTKPKTIIKSFFIEKPLLVEIKINGFRDEIFVLPNQTYNIEYSINEKGLVAKFSDNVAASINAYHDKKAIIIDNHNLRAYYSSLASSSTFQKVITEFDSLENKFLDLLSGSEKALQLPQWFVEYETKNIKAATTLYSIGLSGYQAYLGLESESSKEVEQRINRIDIENPVGITTDFHMGLLNIYLSKKFNQQDVKGKPAKRYALLNKHSVHLKDKRIRDIYNAYLLRKVSKSSYEYSKDLKDQILASISTLNKNYAKKLVSDPILKGKIAPYFYLKNVNDKFIDSRSLKGKLVLLNFWSTSCGPCLKQFPFEAKILKTLEGQDFEIVKICMDTEQEQWKSVLKKYQVKGINLISNKGWDKRLRKKYNKPAYSQYMLIDKEGNVLIEKSLKPNNPKLLDILKTFL